MKHMIETAIKKNHSRSMFTACLIILLIGVLILSSCGAAGNSGTSKAGGGVLKFEDGMSQPVVKYTGPSTPNEDSDIIRYCVYVETDHDTDGDGKADLVKALVQVPRAAAEGQYDAAAIYDPTPYPAGITNNEVGARDYPYAEENFDYEKLYASGEKRKPAGEKNTMDAAEEADSEDWTYTVPGSQGQRTGYYTISTYDYFLIRGFAVVEAAGIGTYGSEGYELCGSDLERDSHKCVVEWLHGDRTAYTDKENNVAISADWCNGNIAMTGTSYGGTLPYEVATTGVEGLKTIIPVAGISNWYDYSNSQGVHTYSTPNYTDLLAGLVSGAEYLDDDWTVTNDDYGAWLKQIAADETKANGNYTGIWKKMDYTLDTDKIKCSALIVHGLNDFNVLTKQSDFMYRSFKKAGQNVKILLHQDGHNSLYGKKVGDQLFDELLNKWLSHYLYDIDNGIEDMAEATVQSNVDGSFSTYDSWGDVEPKHVDAKPESGDAASKPLVRSGSYDDLYAKYIGPDRYPEEFYQSLHGEHAQIYDLKIPEGSTIYGIPQVTVKLAANDVNQDNLMVSGILLDEASDGSVFHAYLTRHSLSNILPVKTIDKYDFGEGHKQGKIKEYVKSPTMAKFFAIGWMDLMDPGATYVSSEQPKKKQLQAGQYNEYTLYLTPTVYTVEKGHTLKLLIFAQDPYRSRLDEVEDATPQFDDEAKDKVYSFNIDNASIDVKLPLR